MENFAGSEGRAIQIRIPFHPHSELGTRQNGSSFPIPDKRNLKLVDLTSCLAWANINGTWPQVFWTHRPYSLISATQNIPFLVLRKEKETLVHIEYHLSDKGLTDPHSTGYPIERSQVSYSPCLTGEETAHSHCTLLLQQSASPFHQNSAQQVAVHFSWETPRTLELGMVNGTIGISFQSCL